MIILGIETSCDETAASVVADGHEIRSTVVSSQIALHEEYGGVVPEIAGRAHIRLLIPVVRDALAAAGLGPDGAGIDAVAVTAGPGLIGSLLIGVAGAKALALAWGVPFVAVNHLEAHLFSPFLEDPDVEPPLVTLLVSGGHTLVTVIDSETSYRVLGGTIDDAAGEAFDKVARLLGLAYPGGPEIERVAAAGDPRAIAFPRGLRDRPYDLSFSGLKTAVANHVRAHPGAVVADVAASFQAAVVDVLVEKTMTAAQAERARGVAIGGGVAANSLLRERIAGAATAAGMRVFLPQRSMCTDNAAMVAAVAWRRLRVDGPSALNTGADPNLRLRGGATHVPGPRR